MERIKELVSQVIDSITIDVDLAFHLADEIAARIANSVYREETGENNNLSTDELISILADNKAVPYHALLSLGMLDEYGDYNLYHNSLSDENYIAAFLTALTFAVNWYFEDYLRINPPYEISELTQGIVPHCLNVSAHKIINNIEIFSSSRWSAEKKDYYFSFNKSEKALYEMFYRPFVNLSLEYVFSWDEHLEALFIIDELVANAIEHAYPEEEDGRIEVRLSISKFMDSITIEVKDWGKGFDLKAALLNEIKLPQDRKRKRGLIYIQKLTGKKLVMENSSGFSLLKANFICKSRELTTIRIDEKSVKIIPRIEIIDSHQAPDMSALLKSAVNEGYTNFLFNWSGVVYIASAGMGSIVNIYKEIKSDGAKFAFIGVGSSLRKIFEVIGFHIWFPIFDTEEEALNYFNE